MTERASEWRPNRDGSWAAVDVGLLRNRKTRDLTAAQALLYVAGLLHCADELTDGTIAGNVLPQLRLEARARPSDVQALVDAGLWRTAGNGWEVPGYLDWNPPKEWWETRRKANARRQAEWRERNREAREQATSNALRNPLATTLRTGVTRRDVTKPPQTPPNGAGSRTCPECGVGIRPPTTLAEHLERMHGVAA